MATPKSFWETYFSCPQLQLGGVDVGPVRDTINYLAPAGTVTDDPTNDCTVVDLSSFVGGVLGAVGADKQFIWNNAGTLAGSTGLTYDSTNNRPVLPNGFAFSATTFKAVVSCTPTGNRTITIQDADQTLVGRDTTDTLTNKTLASPTITGTPKYQGTRASVRGVFTEVQTSAVTQVNCGTFTLSDETTVAIEVIVTSRRQTSNTKRGRWKFSAVVSRTGGGAAVLDDLQVGDALSINGGTVTCDVSGNDFRVRITPADTDARNWDSEMRVGEGLSTP